jgi:hypothetical protein
MVCEELVAFANKYWDIAANHKKGGIIPEDKVRFGAVSAIQIEAEKSAGEDISDYTNIIKPDSIKHIYDNHSNFKTEKSRGNIAITKDDFAMLPSIKDTPDFIISGLKYKNEKRSVYIKYIQGTFFLIGQAQPKQKEMAVRSFYHSNAKLDAVDVLAKLAKDKRYDSSNAKISNGGGGNPPYKARP